MLQLYSCMTLFFNSTTCGVKFVLNLKVDLAILFRPPHSASFNGFQEITGSRILVSIIFLLT